MHIVTTITTACYEFAKSCNKRPDKAARKGEKSIASTLPWSVKQPRDRRACSLPGGYKHSDVFPFSQNSHSFVERENSLLKYHSD